MGLNPTRRLQPELRANHGRQTIIMEMTAQQAFDVAEHLSKEWPLLALQVLAQAEHVERNAALREAWQG